MAQARQRVIAARAGRRAQSITDAGPRRRAEVHHHQSNAVGESQADAFRLIQYAGLKPTGPAPVKGKVRIVTAQTPKAGTQARRGSTVHVTSKIT